MSGAASRFHGAGIGAPTSLTHPSSRMAMSFTVCLSDRSGDDRTFELWRKNAMRLTAISLPLSSMHMRSSISSPAEVELSVTAACAGCAPLPPNLAPTTPSLQYPLLGPSDHDSASYFHAPGGAILTIQRLRNRALPVDEHHSCLAPSLPHNLDASLHCSLVLYGPK